MAVRSVGTGGRAVEVEGPAGRAAVSALTAGLVRLRWRAAGDWRPRRPWAVTPPDDAWPAVAADTQVDERAGRATLTTDALHVTAEAAGTFTVATPDGRVLLRTRPGRAPEPLPDEGGLAIVLEMPHERRSYGLGERTGLLEKRGRRYTCWTTDEWRDHGPRTDALYVAVPFQLWLDEDGRSGGLFVDTTFRSVVDLRDVQGGTQTIEVATDELDLVVLDGPTPGDVVRRLHELVGRAALPPRWAFGYHQARFSYASADEARAVARRLRDEAIPADAIHLDIDRFDAMEPFSWSERFPDPAALVADLAEDGFRTTTVIDAAVPVRDGAGTVYSEGAARDAFLRVSPAPDAPEVRGHVWGGISVLPDHARADVRAWWAGLVRRDLDVGVAGFLDDMNEPSMRDRPVEDPGAANCEPPLEAPQGDPELGATHAEVRNVHGMLMVRATVDAIRAAHPGARPFVVTRAGFAGIARDAIVWTGDNASTWEHLELSLPQLCNLGLSGVPIAGADIGGFFDDCGPELLVRWAQLGACYPFMRNNSARGTARQEPWAWGEPTLGRVRRAIALRYRLLPTLYGIAAESLHAGLPLLRPLVLEHPGEPELRDLHDEALLGRDLLLAPVVRPGVSARAVRLPAGRWVDVRTWRSLPGGRDLLVAASLDDDLPLFARAGSLLALGPDVRTTEERPAAPLELHVIAGDDGAAHGTLYDDDGRTLGHLDVAWSRTHVDAATAADGTVTVGGRREGRFAPPARRLAVVVHGPDDTTRRTELDDAPRWEVRLPAPGAGGSDA